VGFHLIILVKGPIPLAAPKRLFFIIRIPMFTSAPGLTPFSSVGGFGGDGKDSSALLKNAPV